MVYQIKLKQKAKKQLSKLPDKEFYRITETINQLAIDPYKGKKLKGEHKGQYSLRVWPYRIIYEIYKSFLIVVILRIGHRQGVYK